MEDKIGEGVSSWAVVFEWRTRVTGIIGDCEEATRSGGACTEENPNRFGLFNENFERGSEFINFLVRSNKGIEAANLFLVHKFSELLEVFFFIGDHLTEELLQGCFRCFSF